MTIESVLCQSETKAFLDFSSRKNIYTLDAYPILNKNIFLRSARLRRQTFMFLFCLSCIIIFLSSAFWFDSSVIFYPISLKFGM